MRLSTVTLTTAAALALGASAAHACIAPEQGVANGMAAKAAKHAAALAATKEARLRYQSATEYFKYLRNP
jgi:hypothetical protein